LDVAIDGADEVDENLQCIKGGGACLFQEKLVAQAAKKFIIVAGNARHLTILLLDFRKHSKKLGHTWTQGVPIEIVPLAHAKVLRDIIDLGAKHAELRMGGKAKAGPIITDNGNFIIDAHFGEIEDPEGLARSIKMLVGVVEVGLFINMANAAYFGNEGSCHFAFLTNGRWYCDCTGKKQRRKSTSELKAKSVKLCARIVSYNSFGYIINAYVLEDTYAHLHES